jgi:hypothetical protein
LNTHGNDTLLFVKTHGSIKWRALVRFAPPTIPTGCVVGSASLQLIAATWSEGRILQAQELASDWSEQTASWGAQPLTTGLVATTTSGSSVTWDVTTQVQAMLAAGSHYGFQIRDQLEGNANQAAPGFAQQYYSREQSDNGPRLIISWVTAPDTSAPETTLANGPATSTTITQATFSFAASEAGSTFVCSLDGAAFAPCSSPVTYTGLSIGEHTFAVGARDTAGNVDETPATFTWSIVSPPTLPVVEEQEPGADQEPGEGEQPSGGDQPTEGEPPAEGGQPIAGEEPIEGEQPNEGEQPSGSEQPVSDPDEPGIPQAGDNDPLDTTPTIPSDPQSGDEQQPGSALTDPPSPQQPVQEPHTILFLPKVNK